MSGNNGTLESARKQRLVSEWEGMCNARKGCKTACCYYNGSPCEHLSIVDKKKGAGVCSIYPERFGIHKTVAGEEFQCVPMREWLLNKPAPEKCGYRVVNSIEGIPVVRGKP